MYIVHSMKQWCSVIQDFIDRIILLENRESCIVFEQMFGRIPLTKRVPVFSIEIAESTNDVCA